MSGTNSAVAVRNGSVERAAPGALAIQAGQTTWDEYQNAALNQLGLREAGNGDRAVFLHVCQRTGLDPFARQIYMIGRREEVDGEWGKKWTIQTGIEGWRVIRTRAEAREKVRGILGRAVWYDAEGNESKVWFRPEAPTACEITYTVRDLTGGETPYTSVLMFREYFQTTKDGSPTKMWTVKGVHLLEKCVEADVYRKAFPTDFSGVHLDDAMPAPDPDAPPLPGQRVTAEQLRVTAGQARERRAQPATATVVATDASPVPAAPAATAAPPPQQGAGEAPADRPTGAAPAAASAEASANAAPAPAQTAQPGESPYSTPGGGRLATSGQVGMIQQHFKRLGYSDSDDDRVSRLSDTAKIAGVDGDLLTTKYLGSGQAAQVIRVLEKCRDGHALADLLRDGEVPGGM
jgi:phage recombination protein Bet